MTAAQKASKLLVFSSMLPSVIPQTLNDFFKKTQKPLEYLNSLSSHHKKSFKKSNL
jgi:hypothetical protein